MKTYKHKKTGEVAEEYPDYYRTRYWNTVNDIPKRLVEDSSDWEEVIEVSKEWEILSLSSNNNSIVIYKESYTYPECFETLVKHRVDFNVHSIKRLSDNVIFTLGDVAQTIGKYPHIIKSIEIRQKNITRGEKDDIDRIWLNWERDSGGNWLESTEKVEDLHNTQDGFTIRTGDIYYIVENFRVREVLGGTFTKSKWDGFRFKIRENAENWIIRNKQCLSLNDVLANTDLCDSEIEDLIFLIKTRL